MHTTNLRKVGGSIMLAVPPAILEVLRLHAGDTVGVSVDEGRLIVVPQSKPSYTLQELLDQCNGSARLSAEDRAWVRNPNHGRELI